jgi:putative peptidoglycan lipid II flippase
MTVAPGEPVDAAAVEPGSEETVVASLADTAAVPAVTASAFLRAGSGGLGRATALMAGGTLLSRVTGLFRLLVAAYALGGNRLSDAFNLANNTPNIVHDLVLGGVLAATFVPQFVDRLSRRREDEALESISAVVTLSAVLLVVATLLFVLLAPYLIDLYALGSAGRGLAAEKAVATDLLRLFAFQLLGYGAISLMTAVLNTVRRFALAAYVPVINNLVAIAVLLEFASLVAHRPSIGTVQHDHHLVLLLGLGTTLGVIVQAIALLPATLRCGLRLRPVWRPRDPAVREILSLSSWTFGFVVANQVALFVVLALAVHLGHASVTAYTYAFQFFQLPYGMIAVSVMSAVTPELAHRFSLGDRPELARQFGIGLRRMCAGIFPSAVGYLLLAGPLIALLLRHGAYTSADAILTGRMLALLAVGLPGYCTYLLCIRALQAMRDTRTAFFLYLLENGLNVALAFLLTPVVHAEGLSLSLAVAYSVSACAALLVVRRKMGGLGGGKVVGRYLARSAWLSVLMGLVVAAVTAGIGSASGVGLFLRVVAGVVAGVAVYGAGAAFAGGALAVDGRGWQTARTSRRAAGRGTHGRDPSRH